MSARDSHSGNGRAPISDAPESEAPASIEDRITVLERKVDAWFAESKLEGAARDEKLDKILTRIPTTREKQLALSVAMILALSVAAVVQHYTGIQIPIPSAEQLGGAAGLAAVAGALFAARSKAKDVAKKGAPLLVLLVVLTGCGSLLSTAADVANAGAAAGEAAAPMLTELCVEPMKAARARDDVDAGRSIATRCDVPVAAYDTLRVVHVALRAAIVALASGRMPPDLPGLIVQVVDASTKLASAIGGVR